jgi:hypothetical protein
MKVNNILERAEKYRTLGRFDKKSAIVFVNDAIHQIVKRQNLQMKEVYEDDLTTPVVLTAKIIKFESAESDLDDEKYRFRLMNDGSFVLHKLDENESKFKEIKASDNIGVHSITFRFVGFTSVATVEDDINIPIEYETALVNYVRSKMLEEYDELEKSQYFFQQFLKELSMKGTSKRQVVSKPSEYSLR